MEETPGKPGTLPRDERRSGNDDRRSSEGEEREPLPGGVREDDLEPHAGLRYIARLFKILALLLVLLMIGEVIVGLLQQGREMIVYLVVEATRLLVFAGLLWGMGDFALMQIESNHDLRATRILLSRLLGRVEKVTDEADARRR